MRVRVNVGAERRHETVDEGCEAVADSSAAANSPRTPLATPARAEAIQLAAVISSGAVPGRTWAAASSTEGVSAASL